MLAGCTPWPEDVAERYCREGYWTRELLGDVLDPWTETDRERPALVTESGVTTFGELDERTRDVAGGLHAIGLRPGDRIVVQLPNSVEFVAVSLAAFRLGVVPVFALPAHRTHEIVYLCDHAEAVAYVIPGVHLGFDYHELADDVQARTTSVRHVISTGESGRFLSLNGMPADASPSSRDLDPAEVAFFLLSGGTTGAPKLIPRTHQDYAYQLRITTEAVGMDADGVYLAALPAAHNAALGCPGVLGTLRAGGKVVLATSPSPGDVFPLIAREGVTLTTLMPAVLNLWMEMYEFLEPDLSGVLFQIGGARLDAQLARDVSHRLGARLTHWFGMAEGFLSCTRLSDPPGIAEQTTGRPLSPGDEIRVVGEDDRDVERGTIGELLVRGPYTLRGYYRAEQYNRTVFTKDGFLRTGDVVRITDEGNMIVEGRIRDVVNRGGEKVPAHELEEYLMAHAGVHQAAVIPLPDPTLGERTCAFVVPAAEAPKAAALRDYLRSAGLANYKLPDQVEYVESLPQTSLGKVNKRLLRESLRPAGEDGA